MPTSKQPPESLHYFKARLNILKRPRVWAAASGLILSVFLVGKYLVNPQPYTGGNALEADTNPPHQTPLGNLPPQTMPASNGELFETLPNLSTVTTQPLSDSQPLQSEPFRSPLLQEFLLGRSSVAAQKDKPQSLSQSPLFSTSAENRRDPCGICGAARPSESRLPSFSVGAVKVLPASSLTSTAASQSRPSSSSNGSTTINPLQSALDRYSSVGSQAQLSSIHSHAEPLAEHTSGDSDLPATANLVRQNSLNQQGAVPQALPSSQVKPQLSPLPGTTGYTLPSTLQISAPSVRPSSSNGNLQPIPGQIAPQTTPTMPGQVYDYGQLSSPTGQPVYPGVQPSSAPSAPIPSPFSVPRAAPGRSIGGGQINTFSNP